MNSKELSNEPDVEYDAAEFRDAADSVWKVDASGLVIFDPRLSDGAKLTYFAIVYFARQYASSFPGHRRLAKALGKENRTTIYRYIEELKTRKLLTVERRGLGKTNKYWIERLSDAYPAKEVERIRGLTTNPLMMQPCNIRGGSPAPSDVAPVQQEEPEEQEPEDKNPKEAPLTRSARSGPTNGTTSRPKGKPAPELFERSAPGNRIAGTQPPEEPHLAELDTVPSGMRQTEGPIGFDPLDPEDLEAPVYERKVDWDTVGVATTMAATSSKMFGKRGWKLLSRRVKCEHCKKIKTRWKDPTGRISCSPQEGCKGTGAIARVIPEESTPKLRKELPGPVRAIWRTFWGALEVRDDSVVRPRILAGKQIKQIKLMLDHYDLETVEKMALLVVYDWDAIRASWWKAKSCGNLPTLDNFVGLREDLSNHLGTGVTDKLHRVSNYLGRISGKKLKPSGGDLLRDA